MQCCSQTHPGIATDHFSTLFRYSVVHYTIAAALKNSKRKIQVCEIARARANTTLFPARARPKTKFHAKIKLKRFYKQNYTIEM